MQEFHEPPSSADDSHYSLTVEQASDLFVSAGAPRSPRTIIRYCARGHLDCIKVDTEQNEKYLISRESIDRRIEEIQQIAKSSHVSTQRDESRHGSPRRDNDDQPVENSPRLKQKVESLEAEMLDLKIANRAKGQYIEQLQSERTIFLDRISTQSRQIGQLETRLELQGGSSIGQLPEPRPDELNSLSESPVENVDRQPSGPTDGSSSGASDVIEEPDQREEPLSEQ